MRKTLLGLGLLVWQACCQDQGQCPDFGTLDIKESLLGQSSGQNVCYEYVVVLTYSLDVVPTSTGDVVTIDELYTGTSSITAPITTTIFPDGGGPETVLVLTPEAAADVVTIDEPYTGTSSITAPITTTIFPDGGGPETVLILTPEAAADVVTIDEAYTGTSHITAPITTTILPDGNGPETVLILTPQATPSYITITRVHTGTPPISEPTTVTIAPTADGERGTVIVELPEASPYITEEEPYTGTSSITEPITVTIPPNGDIPGTVIIEDPPNETTTEEPTTEPITSAPSSTSTGPPEPTFSCDAGGFLIQENTLYRLNLATGENPVVKDHVGPGGNINALGYNVLDNYLYGFDGIGNSRQQLIRIDSVGGYTLLPLIIPYSGISLNVGDIDNNGQFWVSARGNKWYQVDLKPGSDTFGEIVDQGATSGTPVADWVYLESGGDYLYSIRLGNDAIAVRWSRTTHVWEVVQNYGVVTTGRGGFGALYAVGNELWGSDNQSGDIYAFPVEAGGTARLISDGPATDSNDGARCFRAPPPEEGF